MVGPSIESNKVVIYLTPGFPKDEKDFNCLPSVQGFFQSINEHKKSFQIIIISLQYPFTTGWYKWHGIWVYSLGGKNRKGINRINTFIKAFIAINKIRKEQSIKLIHSFWMTGTAMVGSIYSKFFNTNHVISLLGQDVTKENFYLHILPFKKDEIVANSEQCLSTFQLNKKCERGVVVHLGINEKQYKPITISDQYDIVGCGSLTKLKQFDHFIRIIEKIKFEYPTIKSVIIGDGPERENLEQMIVEKRLKDNIKIIGAIEHHSIISYLSKAKLLLHTSRYEASSHVMLEANYSRIFSVSYHVGHFHDERINLLGQTIEELSLHCIKILREKISFPEIKLPTIEQTVLNYLALYDKIDENR